MKFLRFASGVALAVTLFVPAAKAYTLEQAAQPAERPPAAYTADVYVDSRGCAYVRATIGSVVNWVPRLSRDRKTVVCGLTPTAQVAGLASARPPAPPKPPAPTAVAASTAPASAAPQPTPVQQAVATAAPASNEVTRTMAVTCPANGAKARLRIGSDTISIRCSPAQTTTKSFIVRHANGDRTRVIAKPPLAPVPAASAVDTNGNRVTFGDVTADGRVRVGGGTPRETRTIEAPGGGYTFGAGYGLTNYPGASDPVPSPGSAAQVRTAAASSIGSGSATAPVPAAAEVVIPSGYRSAWDDDRLNPLRGPRTAQGDAQMARTMTSDEVPMRSVNTAPARQVAAAAPAKRYVQVGMFNVPENAARAAAKLKSLGLPGRVAKTRSGKTVVIAGPYDSVAALRAALATARTSFPDAFLRN